MARRQRSSLPSLLSLAVLAAAPPALAVDAAARRALDSFCAETKPAAGAPKPCTGVANLAVFELARRGLEVDEGGRAHCQQVCERTMAARAEDGAAPALAGLDAATRTTLDTECANTKPSPTAQNACAGVANLVTFRLAKSGVQLDDAGMSYCQQVCERTHGTDTAQAERPRIHDLNGAALRKGAGGSAQARQEADALYAEHTRLFKSRRYRDCVPVLEKLIALGERESLPREVAKGYTQLGGVYVKLKDARRAEKALTHALSLGEDPLPYHYLFVTALEVKRSPSEAERWAEKGLRKFPGDDKLSRDVAQLALDRGDAELQRKRYSAALRHYEKAAKLAPDLGIVQVKLGWAQCGSGQWSRCKRSLEKARSLDPSIGRDPAFRQLYDMARSRAR